MCTTGHPTTIQETEEANKGRDEAFCVATDAESQLYAKVFEREQLHAQITQTQARTVLHILTTC